MSIPYGTLKTTEPLFSFVDPDGTKIHTLAIDRLRNSLAAKLQPTEPLTLSQETGFKLLDAGAVRPGKLALLVRSTDILPLVYLARFSSGTSVIVDGFESYCAALARGAMVARCKRLPQSIWHDCSVSGVPYTSERLLGIVKNSTTAQTEH